MQMVEWNLIRIIFKNLHVVNALYRSNNHPINGNYSKIPIN